MASLLAPTPDIGEIIRNAWLFNPKHWPEASMANDDVIRSIPRLFRLLQEREIDYVLVGGIAMLQYVEGRNTESINFILSAPALTQISEIQVLGQERYFARGNFEGLQIDFLLTNNPLFQVVQKHYVQTIAFANHDIPCATVEGLLLLKLYALPSLYRQGNFARVGLYENDIATLLYTYTPKRAPLFRELKKHLSASDLQAIQEVVDDISARLTRFAKRSRMILAHNAIPSGSGARCGLANDLAAVVAMHAHGPCALPNNASWGETR